MWLWSMEGKSRNKVHQVDTGYVKGMRHKDVRSRIEKGEPFQVLEDSGGGEPRM